MRPSLIIAFLLTATLCYSQMRFGALKGEVYDKSYEEPLAFATVVLMIADEVKVGAYTDLDGKFCIKPIPPGTYDLLVRSVGITDYKMVGIVVGADKITFLDRIELRTNVPEPCACPPRAPFYVPPATNMEKIGPIQIKALPTRKSPVQLVASLSSELKLDDEFEKISYRGSAFASNGIYVDGVKWKDGDLNGVPGSSIQELTVYTGHIPANFGDATGAIVEIEIKSYFQLYHDWKYPPSSYYLAPNW